MPGLVTTLCIVAALLTVIVPLAAATLATADIPRGHRRPLSRRIEQHAIRVAVAALTRLERLTSR